jgi:uncharacterized membrane protein SpoIIM required for sporulation
MTQQSFVRRREGFWNEFEGMINGGKRKIKDRASWFPQGFREITQDLNTAKAHAFDPSIIDRLNRLVLEGNQILYGQRSWSPKGGLDFILRTFPRAVRSQWRGVSAALFIFYGVMVFFIILCVRFPRMVYEIMSEEEAKFLEMMYDPSSPQFLTPRDVSSDADMFGYYIYNNISIAFRTFAGGILAGFGSLFLLCANAVFLGTAAGHIINKGFSGTFFPFIIGHGSFELTAIVLSAYGGLLLGYRFFITQGLTRSASLKAAGKSALPIITGSALMLVLAAVIEAFWSSRFTLPMFVRLGLGGAGWAFVILYFLFAGREKKP